MAPDASPLSFFVSSGDMLADRRYAFARDLAARGDHAAAADLLEQTVDRVCGFAAAWFALGEARLQLADPQGAAQAFRRCLACDPADRCGARLHLGRLGVEEIATAMSPAYVAHLFDQYAPRFERELAEHLQYRGPDLLLEAIHATRGREPRRLARALDLGCGTGLMGERLRSVADTLVGVDLSSGMVAAAARKGCYDRLVMADIVAFLTEEARGGARYDLVTAADVFVYFADLAKACAAAAQALAPGGLLAFTVETHEGDGVVLGETLRYAHGAKHVLVALSAAGFANVTLTPAATRTERRVPVLGLLVLATA